MKAALGEDPVDLGEPELERQRHTIGEDQRCCTRATLTTIDCHRIHAPAGLLHQVGEFVPEIEITDGRLDSHRQARSGGE